MTWLRWLSGLATAVIIGGFALVFGLGSRKPTPQRLIEWERKRADELVRVEEQAELEAQLVRDEAQRKLKEVEREGARLADGHDLESLGKFFDES